MKKDFKSFLLHLRDILVILPYLSPRITFPLFWRWFISLRFNMGISVSIFRMKKHRFILNYLKSRYNDLIPSTLTLGIETQDKSDVKLPIWVFWYQGFANMPPLVRLCYNSVLRNSCGRPVYLLDKDNVLKYVQIPYFILEKRQQGIISIQNFSDILRLILLYNYGGSWLDATLYVAKPLSEKGLNPYFESIKMPSLLNGTISDYRWATFCLYAKPKSNAICCSRDIMLAYFRDGHKRIIDYLLIDYTFQMLYEQCDEFRKIIDEKPRTSEYTYEMVRALNKPYDSNFLEQWKDQQFFKLNWRMQLDDGDTLFHHLEKQND